MLTRYGNIDYISNLLWLEGVEQINKAFEKQNEKRAWDMWLTKYQHMDKNNFVKFSDFYKKATNTQTSKRTAEEILKEAQEIRKSIGTQ